MLPLSEDEWIGTELESRLREKNGQSDQNHRLVSTQGAEEGSNR
jgi:hypothetical protein